MTRARGPASHEPDDPAVDERDTVLLPPVHPAPAVPEVPALTDLATPGRPDVDTVVSPEQPPARHRPRPSPRMRARADEMARVLSRATPTPRRPRRGLSSVPAAAAVMAAVAVGGVGIALGLDAQRTGQQLALPDVPRVPGEQTAGRTDPVTDGGTAPTAGTSLLGPSDTDDAARPAPRPTAQAAPSSVAPRAEHGGSTTNAPGTTTSPPRTTTSTTARDTTSSPTPRSTSSSRPSTRADDEATQERQGAPTARRGLGTLGMSSRAPLDGGGATAG